MTGRVVSEQVTADDLSSFPVAEGEDPWTADEIAEVRDELWDEHGRMTRALDVAQAGLQDLLQDASDGAGEIPPMSGPQTSSATKRCRWLPTLARCWTRSTWRCT